MLPGFFLRDSRTRATLCAAAVALAAPVSAQTVDKPATSAARPTDDLSGAAAAVDVNTIDPETFHAIASRLPAGQAPTIDGRLNEALWQLAPASGDFVQREPRFGAPATERTEFRILYDDRKIYFGVWAYDSDVAGILATELKRDSGLSKGDQLKIIIDTFHDHRNAFAFNTNPLGALKDAHTVDDGRIINYDWNAVWEVKTSSDEQGWYAEIAIPLSQLRFKGGLGETTWGLNVCRVIIRKQEETYWVPYAREWGAQGFTRMSHAGVLLGLRDLPSRRRLEFLPYAAPLVARDYDAATPTTAEAKYGFDMRVGLTSNLTADLTYRTDFAQVEADQEVVNLSRFSLFFPEKRQFFTESAGIFDYGRTGSATSFLGGDAREQTPGLLSLFYSRRIGLHEGREVPIVGGGKVAGRSGAYTIGVMNVETDEARADETRLPRANYTVLRVKRNVLAKSSLGGIFLNRQAGATAYNRAAGVDAGLALGRSLNLTGLLARTFSPGAHGGDLAGGLDVAWKNDRLNYDLTYLDIGERFNAEMGFIPRIDIRNSRASAAWTPRPGWRGVRQLTVGGKVDYYEKHSGEIDSRNANVTFKIERQDSSTFNASLDRDYDLLPFDWQVGAGTIPIGGYTWNTFRVSYNSNKSKQVSGTVGVDTGGYYNGDKQSYKLNLNFLIGDMLLIEPNYTRNHVRLPDAPRYVTNVFNTRVSYSFSPDLFLKGFFQYNDDRRLATFNFLFWYIYRPGSDLYIVYNHGWETDEAGKAPRIIRVRNRSLAVKMTYWLSR